MTMKIDDEPIQDVLIEGPLHKVMVVFHIPAGWPAWGIFLLGLALVGAAALPWWWFLGAAGAWGAALVLGVFMLADTAVLRTLPRQRISFGPWKAQFAALAAPRVLAAMALSLAGVWLGVNGSLGLLVAMQLLGTAALIWGAMVEPFRLELSEYHLFTDRLPVNADPIRLLHISDLHVERLTDRESRVLKLAQMTKPDLILITGDYVNLSYNRDPETQTQVVQLLGKLSAPYGVYATLGSPPVDLRETVLPIFEQLPGIKLLRRDWDQVDLGDGRQLIVVGMDCTHHLPTDRKRLHNLLQTAPNRAPQVLLYHSPELMPQASEHEVDLYLCGHTHGGQVRLPLVGPILTSSQLGRQYVMGLYRSGRTHLYVSRGIGLEGLSAPRVRFMAPPEMTLITLQGKGMPKDGQR